MALLKDKNGLYAVRFYTWNPEGGGRKRVYRTLGKIPYREAKPLHDQMVHESHGSKVVSEPTTISQALESYIRLYGVNLAEGTKKGLYGYKRHYIRIFGDVPCQQLAKARLQEYINTRLAETVQNSPNKKIATSSVKRELAFLRTILNRAVESDLISVNPTNGFKLNQLPTSSRKNFFEREELELFWNAFTGKDAQFKDFFKILFLTGSRTSEIIALSWWNVDFKRGQVSIRLLKQRKIERSKVIPLSAEGKAILDRRYASAERKDGLVFSNEAGEPLKIDRIEKVFRRVLEASGIRKRLTPHSLRHTFGSLAAAEGASIFHVQHALGHSDVRMTAEFYAHMQPSNLQGVVDLVAGSSKVGNDSPMTSLGEKTK